VQRVEGCARAAGIEIVDEFRDMSEI